MEDVKSLDLIDDWQALLSFLPQGWEQKAKELGAFSRSRKLATPEILLRVFLIHFTTGCSLRETVSRAKSGGFASISDVALLKRIKRAGDWLRWMAENVMRNWIIRPSSDMNKELNFRVIDGTTVQEPGATGSTWRIHYSIQLHSLACDESHVTLPTEGETLKRYTIRKNDVLLCDRGYSSLSNIEYVAANDGHILVRVNMNLPLFDEEGNKFCYLDKLRTLEIGQSGDWIVYAKTQSGDIVGRICAAKKSNDAAEMSRKKVLRRASKKGEQVKESTLEMASYFVVFTTLGKAYGAKSILEMYRRRWQIELVFKRLKSIIGLGHLKKTEIEGAKAWIHGKLLVALLIEAMIAASDRFSPWGYSIPLAVE